VLPYPGDRDQIVRPGDAVNLGDAFDGEQLLGERLHATGFDVEQDECGDHLAGYRPARGLPSRFGEVARDDRLCPHRARDFADARQD